MKIKSTQMSYEDVMKLARPEHKKPCKPSLLLGTVVRLASIPDLMQVGFTYEKENMEKAGDGPWLILMNHSSFLDLEMVSKMMYPRTYNIVCTSDGLVGKEGLMRRLGCIPTQKFVSDISLISDIKYALHENKRSVLMYPEASYSFDGTATPLPRRLGVFFKAIKAPVVMISTYGSFTRDPLYNNLQKRRVKASAKMECLLSIDEVKSKTVEEIDSILDKAFSFDYFKWQYDNSIEVSEEFRADGLNRILYKCASCGCEGNTEGKGVNFICHDCGSKFKLSPLGQLESLSNEPARFPHIPDWYAWQRQCVRDEINSDSYLLDTDVDIGVIVDFESLYMVGSGRLRHDNNGFTLDGCDGKLHYEQGPSACYSLYSDYFWYEIGDVICIGNKDCLYYCFPKKKDVVAKARIAAEEMFKIHRANKRGGRIANS